MGVFDRQIATATRVIKAKGELCQWQSAAAPVIADPTKPWIATQAAPVNRLVSILFPTSSSDPLLKLIAGSSIEQGKSKGLMAAVSFVPQLTDTVTRTDGTVLAINKLDQLKPNGQSILWYLEFKQ
jgi:hypothetical protein